MKDLPFAILAEGPYDPSQIHIHHTDQRIVRSPELDELIEEQWLKTSKGDPNFLNGSKVLVKEVAQRNHRLDIVTGLTDFKERVGTQKPEIAHRFGMPSVAITMGATGVMVTADNALLLAQRLTPHRTKSGGLHILGGMVDLADVKKDTIDISGVVLRESAEETGIPINELEVASCLGVMQSTESYAVDVLFALKTRLTEAEIRPLEGDREIRRIFVENDPESLRYTLLTFLKTASSPSMAALYLYGSQRFGEEWRWNVAERLSRRASAYDQQFSTLALGRARDRIEGRLHQLSDQRIVYET